MKLRRLIKELEKNLGRDAVVSNPEELLVYEYDASLERGLPQVAVFPRSTADVVRAIRLANQAGIPIVSRGAGTGLSGGAVAPRGGMLLVFSRMNRILETDLENQRAVVEAGVVNLELTNTVASQGYYFAPDPSSQKACTIGGNVAENAGGPHTLAYGVTANHVLGLEVVLPEGKVVTLGGSASDTSGYDLTGLLVGSEGTLAIVTKVVVRLSRLPEAVKTLLAVFQTLDDATETVAEITARGITPAACEMLDRPVLQAVEAAARAGYPLDAAAVLLLELEGLREAVEVQAEEIRQVCQHNHAREVRLARNETERDRLWQGRKNAFGAFGRLAPSIYTQDGVVPRTKLPLMLRRMAEIGAEHDLTIGCVAHAGDGNFHPVISLDAREPQAFERVSGAATGIMRTCAELGGTITGEHGVGLEKKELMPLVFSEEDLKVMAKIKAVFDPSGRLNPSQMFPSTKSCGEIRLRPLRHRTPE